MVNTGELSTAQIIAILVRLSLRALSAKAAEDGGGFVTLE